LHFSYVFNLTIHYWWLELYSVKPKATRHVTRQSKHQCTCLGSVPNLNSQASSPFRKGWKLPYQIWK